MIELFSICEFSTYKRYVNHNFVLQYSKNQSYSSDGKIIQFSSVLHQSISGRTPEKEPDILELVFIGWAGPQGSMLELTSETILLVFVKQTKIGSHVPNLKACQEGRLQKLLKTSGSENLSEPCDYDLIIIGGGSGGLAAAKESAKYNKC